MAKITLYDYLEVSSKAAPEMIAHAYERKRALLAACDQNDPEVRNQSAFVEAAWRTLSDPLARQRYDDSLLQPLLLPAQRARTLADDADHDSLFLSWWNTRKVSMVLAGIALTVVGAFAYNTHAVKERTRLEAERLRIEELKAAAAARAEAERIAIEAARVDNERAAAERMSANQRLAIDNQGRSIDNQGRGIDRSYDIANRREDRADRELELRRQRQQWQQEQAERERVRRDALATAARNKRELCNLYRSNGQVLLYRQEGC